MKRKYIVKKEAQDVEVNNSECEENPQNVEEETNSKKDSEFSGNNTSQDENEEELVFIKMQISHVHFVDK